MLTRSSQRASSSCRPDPVDKILVLGVPNFSSIFGEGAHKQFQVVSLDGDNILNACSYYVYDFNRLFNLV